MATTSINLADLDGSNGFRLNVEAEYSLRSVRNAGDVNGDGLDDLSFSIFGDSSKNSSISSYVVFGKVAGFEAEMDLSELDGNNGFRLNGWSSFSNAGDVNGDGFDDVIIGNYFGDLAYVVFGKASGFDATLELSSLDGSNGFRLNVEEGYSLRSVSDAGDVNGDGFDDVMIGDFRAVFNGKKSGSSYVVFGKASGFDATMSVFDLDGSNGIRIDGAGSRDLVKTAGDVNGDGFGDVIIGTRYVVFGKASGFDAAMNLSTLDGSNGFRLSFRLNGGGVSNAGDVNGDGFGDLIIGGYDSSYVVFGKASGFDAEMSLYTLDGSNGFRMDGLTLGSSLSAAGDVNGDGFDDVIVGAPARMNNNQVSSYVVFGKASGFDATVNLMPLNRVLEDSSYLGSSVSGAGDVNGDGFDDLMVGAGGAVIYDDGNGYSHFSNSSGYVIFGNSDFAGLTAYLGTPGDDVLTGTPTAEIFYAGDGDDTLIGGGGADTIFGGSENDTIRVSDPDFLRVDGGSGSSSDEENDTLSLDGSGLNLDLTAVGDKVAGIEIIDLSGTGDNVLTLAAADMPGILRDIGNKALIVKGNAGDQVNLGSGWLDRGFQGDFHMFSIQNGVVLMVADAVSVDFVNGGHMKLSDLNGNNGFRLDGVAAHDRSGRSVSNAGDVNGDGFDDVIVGAWGADPNGEHSGSSYVVFGKAAGFDAAMNLSSLNGTNGFRLDGEVANDYSGLSVSNAGDVNGDGFDDVIVGAWGADPNGEHSGSSYVVFGKAAGFDAAMNLSSLNGTNGFRLDGEAASDSSARVSNAGDVNGDGFDDVIIGAAGADTNSDYRNEGSSYVVFGKASGFAATMNLSTLDGSNGFRLDGEAAGNYSGLSVSNAGDVNGDGFGDVIISAFRGSLRYGSSYVVFGKAAGFDAAMNLSDLDGSNGFRMKEAHGDIIGRTISTAGDVNGDGFGDVIISIHGHSYYNGVGDYINSRGGSYVVFGKASGFDAEMNLSELDGSNGFRLNEERDYLGVSVSSAGDVNGDGFDDVIIADPNEQDRFGSASSGSGSSYVMFGKASGFSAVADLSDLEGDEGFRLDDAGIWVTSVSGAGDVNGDGFDDLIAGAYSADWNSQDSGSSYVIFGRSDFTGGPDFLGTPGDDVFTGTSAAESFVTLDGDDRMIGGGGADSFVGGAGDDVMQIADVGFVLANGGSDFDTLEWAGGGFSLNLSNAGDRIQSIEAIDVTGSGNHRLILSVQDVLNLSDETNTLRIKGNTGDSVAGLGSGWVDGGIQGDVRTYIQFDAVLQIDVAVRTDFVDDNAISLFSLNGSNGFRLDGETAHDRSGRSVSIAGDVNGDGFDDVIVGAWGADPNGEYSGSSYVVFGKASGFDATMNLSDLDGSNGFRLDGVAKYDYSGRSVSNAGDVNGDGFDDVIVGARGADTNGEHSGYSYVVFGKAAGFDAAMNLSDLDGSNGFRLDGEAASDRGRSVSNAGDVNGDGFDDVIIGANYANPNGNDSGSSYVVFGKASGFDATMNLSDLDGNNGFRLDGETAHDRSGWSVSSAGDVNGDGFDDVIIAALYARPNGYGSGSSYVVFGKATGFDAAMNLSGLDGGNGFRLDGVSVYDLSVSSAGDVNGDGFDDVIIGVPDVDPNGERSGSSYVVFGKTSGFDATMDLSSLDGANGFRLDGVAKRDDSGRSVSSAGDVNGDGFDDVIVDAMDSSYVVFGKVSGFDAVMNLSDLDGSTGFRIDAVTKHYSFSGSVSGAGDVNGDDFDDLIVGAAFADSNGENSGSSYIIFGRSDFVSNVDFPGTAGNDELTGTKAAERFDAGAGNDKMIGRGGADEFYGQAGDDYIRVSDLNFQWVDGGTGRDTLGLGGSGLNLDLSSVNGRISDIETIYLYGTGDNTLTLTALDVLNLSDTSNTLRVNGNEGDRIVGLGSGWDDSGIHGKFNTYTQGEAVLLVGVNVATDFV